MHCVDKSKSTRLYKELNVRSAKLEPSGMQLSRDLARVALRYRCRTTYPRAGSRAGSRSGMRPESGSRSRHFFDVLYICRKSTLAESTSLGGSRATLGAKLRAFCAVSTQIFPMMPHNVIDHLALAIAQDLVISAILGQQPADGLHEPFWHGQCKFPINTGTEDCLM